MDIDSLVERNVTIAAPFSLAATCGPVAWVAHRSPRHAWRDGTLTWVGWDGGRVAWRAVRQWSTDEIVIKGSLVEQDADEEWGRKVLGSARILPSFDDQTLAELATRFAGMRPYSDGSLFDGLVTAIVGQSISVAAAAVTQARLAALFAPAVWIDGREYRPLPRSDQLAESSPALVRRSGVTMRRAEALVHAGRAMVAGELPGDEDARRDPAACTTALRALPLVGRWTAESALLWGVGAPDAYPTGDVALLRAARHAYERPELTMRELDAIAEGWTPARGLAARLLWTGLFGGAGETEDP